MNHADAARAALLATALAGCRSTVVVDHAGAGGAHAGTGGAHAGTGGAHAGTGGAHAGTGGASGTSTTTGSGGSVGSTGTMPTKVCTTDCHVDADCQSTCPASGGTLNCCDVTTGMCFTSAGSTCPPPPCVGGLPCQPGSPSCTDPYEGPSCTCSCGTSGTTTCNQAIPPPSCPADHPLCGAPCMAPPSTCTCSLGPGQGTTGCSCSQAGVWACSSGGACPPLMPIGAFVGPCTDFPLGLACAQPVFPPYACTCTALCGTQVWICSGV